MKYPTLDEIEAMRSRGDDTKVTEQQWGLYQRGRRAGSIKDQIRRAFKDVRLGSGVDLWEAQGIDDADAATCAAFREKDEKNDWSLIPAVELNRSYSSPSFFDAADVA